MTLTTTEMNRLKNWLQKELPNDHDTFDLTAEVDSEISYDENITILKQKLSGVLTQDAKEAYQNGLEKDIRSRSRSDNTVFQEIMENSKAVVVLGDRRSGKTSLSMQLLLNSTRELYVFKHPRPELIQKLGVKVCYDFAQLSKLEDATVYVDEAGIELPLEDRKANKKLILLMTVAGQRGIKLIFSTSDTRYFTRTEEPFIDTWICKDLNYDLIKIGSPVRKAIENWERLDASSFSLETNEYLVYNRKLKHLNTKHTFKLPEWWSERHSKPYSDKLFSEMPASVEKRHVSEENAAQNTTKLSDNLFQTKNPKSLNNDDHF